jgi:hypothetical protein
MSGTDDRSPGSIEDLALSWGLTPEQARKVADIAVALAAGTYPVDEYVPRPRRCTPRLPTQHRASPATRTDDATTTDETE